MRFSSIRRSLGRGGRRTAAATCFAIALIVLYFTTALTGDGAYRVAGDPNGTMVYPMQEGDRVPQVTPVPVAVDQLTIHREEAVDPNAVHFTDIRELTTPLPRDAEVRDAAFEQVREEAAARGYARPPDAQFAPGPTTTTGPPMQRSTHEVPSLAGQAFVAQTVDGGEYNLKLPDKFTPTLEELQAGQPEAIVDESDLAPMASGLIQQFEGIDQTNLRPPDPDIAAGPDHVVAVVNSRFAFYDKCGTNLYENNFADYWNNTTDFFFDPKVIFDRWDDRWIMTICVRNNTSHDSRILLMISDDDDPSGSWCGYYFQYGTTNWADYQDVGAHTDCVYITANMFDWSTPNKLFQHTIIRQIEKAPLLACESVGARDFTGMTNPNDGTLAFSVRASDPMTWGADYWMINSVSYGNDFLTLWSISGGWPAPVLNSWDLAVTAYDDPPPLLQGDGTYVDCGDARLMNAAYYNGNLWACNGQRYDFGTGDRSVVGLYQVNTVAKTIHYQTRYGASNLYYAYPAVELDSSLDGVICFSRGGPTEFVGSRYSNVPSGGPISGSSLLVAGLSDYDDNFNAGTAAEPFRWGDYYGCDLDAYDNRTLWMYGQFASDDPDPTWDTHIGATSIDGAGVLGVTPVNAFVSYGPEGGPFTPPSILYSLSNTGGTALYWDLTGWANWETPNITGGKIYPGGTQNLTMTIDSDANALGPNIYTDWYYMTDCYNGSLFGRRTDLWVGADGECPGSIVELPPDGPADHVNSTHTPGERGMFVTAIKDFEICAVGWEAELELPQVLYARIYAADGNARGALLAQGQVYAVEPGKVVHYIPINYTLQTCEEYDISITFGDVDSWDWWNETLHDMPMDRGGVIRVRKAHYAGVPNNVALINLSLIGAEPACDVVAELIPETPPDFNVTDNFNERGIFVTADRTASLCTFGQRIDLVPPQTVTARVYEATGTARGALIAEGTADVTSAGMMWHDIPINVTLLEGQDYDVTFYFGQTNSWDFWDERTFPPFSDGPFDNINGELSGNASNFALPHYRVGWAEPVGGTPFDLALPGGPWPGHHTTTQDIHDYGAFVKSLIYQEVYSVGWMADVPEGEVIGARVYDATGTTRGALISEGTILSSGSGLRWHDVPVAATMFNYSDYDIEIDIGQVDEWHSWSDGSLPFDAYGVMRVVDGEQGGSASNGWLVHMRYNGCNKTATAVAESGPQRAPMFLATPAPNPISSTAKIRFGLDEDAAVTMAVYDVKGRRVATIFSGQHRPMGEHTVEINAHDLPSGVYFVKLSTPMKSMSRKIVVTH